MGKIAFVFSGQGDQYPGMGKELYEKYPTARGIYEMCDRLRPGTLAQCFQGSEEELKKTKNTQPCQFAMELAAASILIEKGIIPGATAGFSLGEVVAATVSGLFNYETGFQLVCKRGSFMQQAADQFDTSMAAVVKLEADRVQEICSRYKDVYPVNYNCPGQVTVSGLSSQMADFYSDIKAAGGRAIPLKVKGAFHSVFMKQAAQSFLEELKQAEIKKPVITIYSNMTAKPYTENVAELLSKQICSPVLWEQSIRNMIADGVDTFIEIGPGKTLTNMIKKIDGNVKTYSVMEYLAEVELC